MKIAGIIVEYNPLHNGHLYHLEQTKAVSNADLVIAVMSSHVVQRGEFSLIDKFTKTRWALEAGIDLVIELPGILTLQNADRFAFTAVDILNHLGTDVIVFGSESGEVEPLKFMLDIMETHVYQDRLKALLDSGKSFPSANDIALSELTDSTVLKTPNNILGLQYIRAIRTLNADIEPVAIKRLDTHYYDDIDENTAIQSATAIRKAQLNNQAFQAYVPDYVSKSLREKPCFSLNDFTPFLAYKLASLDGKTMHKIHGMEEGIENRFLQIQPFSTFEAFVDKAVTPRYTQAKIKRTVMHLLINTLKKDLASFHAPYIRVLGMNKNGQNHLNTIKKDLQVPLITKLKNKRHRYLDYELRITKIYDLVAKDNLFEKEFKPVIIL